VTGHGKVARPHGRGGKETVSVAVRLWRVTARGGCRRGRVAAIGGFAARLQIASLWTVAGPGQTLNAWSRSRRVEIGTRRQLLVCSITVGDDLKAATPRSQWSS
jgi:hypothetical protein